MMPERNNQNSSAASSNRRRKYLIHPRFQWKYALTLSIAVFLFCIILSCGLFASLHEEARRRVINPAEYQGSVVTVILSASIVYSLLTAGMIGFWMILTTHRFCGPIYVLQRHFETLAEGRMPELRPLRRKDELKEVFATFSKALERLRGDKQSQLDAVNNALACTRSQGYSGEQECKDALDAVRKQLDGIRRGLAESLGEQLQADQPGPTKRQLSPVGAA